MSRKTQSAARKTATIPVDQDAIMTVAHEDCLLLITVTRVPGLSDDEEERVLQRCRTLQVAIADAKALSDDEEEVIPFDPSRWQLPIPVQT